MNKTQTEMTMNSQSIQTLIDAGYEMVETKTFVKTHVRFVKGNVEITERNGKWVVTAYVAKTGEYLSFLDAGLSVGEAIEIANRASEVVAEIKAARAKIASVNVDE